MQDTDWSDVTRQGIPGSNGPINITRTPEQSEEMLSSLVARVAYLCDRADVSEARCEERHQELLAKFDTLQKMMATLTNRVFVLAAIRVALPKLLAFGACGAAVEIIWRLAQAH